MFSKRQLCPARLDVLAPTPTARSRKIFLTIILAWVYILSQHQVSIVDALDPQKIQQGDQDEKQAQSPRREPGGRSSAPENNEVEGAQYHVPSTERQSSTASTSTTASGGAVLKKQEKKEEKQGTHDRLNSPLDHHQLQGKAKDRGEEEHKGDHQTSSAGEDRHQADSTTAADGDRALKQKLRHGKNNKMREGPRGNEKTRRNNKTGDISSRAERASSSRQEQDVDHEAHRAYVQQGHVFLCGGFGVLLFLLSLVLLYFCACHVQENQVHGSWVAMFSRYSTSGPYTEQVVQVSEHDHYPTAQPEDSTSHHDHERRTKNKRPRHK
ncbi:unnamed protein product [Amoebophrya sp. A120]|nr:unnamed protein product [Amoebophrya sp. A120]|eukprot:GSA120T00023651001.1